MDRSRADRLMGRQAMPRLETGTLTLAAVRNCPPVLIYLKKVNYVQSLAV